MTYAGDGAKVAGWQRGPESSQRLSICARGPAIGMGLKSVAHNVDSTVHGTPGERQL